MTGLIHRENISSVSPRNHHLMISISIYDIVKNMPKNVVTSEGLFLAMLEFIADIVGWMTIKTSHSTTLDGLDSGYQNKCTGQCTEMQI